jgi:DNA-binding LacI/PurR family transcriptional regulator
VATLKDVASAADVPMLTAFHALKDDRTIDAAVRQRVADEARRLKLLIWQASPRVRFRMPSTTAA